MTTDKKPDEAQERPITLQIADELRRILETKMIMSTNGQERVYLSPFTHEDLVRGRQLLVKLDDLAAAADVNIKGDKDGR